MAYLDRGVCVDYSGSSEEGEEKKRKKMLNLLHQWLVTGLREEIKKDKRRKRTEQAVEYTY